MISYHYQLLLHPELLNHFILIQREKSIIIMVYSISIILSKYLIVHDY